MGLYCMQQARMTGLSGRPGASLRGVVTLLGFALLVIGTVLYAQVCCTNQDVLQSLHLSLK